MKTTPTKTNILLKEHFVLVLVLHCFFNLNAQNPHRFDSDIKKFAAIEVPEDQKITVFTGSSSIRFWEDLTLDCNSTYAINTGFGGSQMSDLLYFLEETVLRFSPSKVYIYEGDNDIVALKSTEEILRTTQQIVNRLKEKLPSVEIVLISAKPSPSRWGFKTQYLELNDAFKKYAQMTKQVAFIDVWTLMLDDRGYPKSSIFISDSLHMNRKGYVLWRDQICDN